MHNKEGWQMWWETSSLKQYLDYMGWKTLEDLPNTPKSIDERFIERITPSLDAQQLKFIKDEFSLYLKVKE